MTEHKRFVDKGIITIVDQGLTDTLTDKDYWVEDGLVDIVELLNNLHEENKKLTKENKELKLDNDIKFWKQEYLQLSNHQQVIFHELAEAFKQGYKPSKEYQKMRNDEKKRIEECNQKMERLRI